MKKSLKKYSIMFAAVTALSAVAIVTDANAAGYDVYANARTANFANWDRLNLRKWPASYSQKLSHVKRGRTVFVERCIIKSGADWCKIRKGWKRGWVNGKFIRKGGYTFAQPHPWF